MLDMKKVIAWLADEELYYRDHGDTHNSLMACNALELLKEQEERINKMLHQPRSVICCYRCKWNSGTQDKPYCQKYSMGRLPEWFCADGERKEGR